MSSEVRLVPAHDATEWDALVAAHPAATAFNDWAWLDFVSDLLQVDFRRLLVVRDGRPVGVLPVPLRAGRGPRRALESPSLPFPYLGPVVPSELLVPTMVELRRHLLRHGPLVAHVELVPTEVDPETMTALQRAGVSVHEDSTVVVDTAHGSVEALTRGLDKGRRRQVRRAGDAGTVVRPARPGELADLLPPVLSEAYESHGAVSPYPDDIGHRVEAYAAGRSDVTCLVATVGDELAGAQVMLGGHPTAMLWIGGCLRRFRDQSANAKLLAVSLEHAVEHGFARVDFSGWVDDAVGTYKLGFGGERRPYLVLRTSPMPTAARSVLKQAAGRVRRRAPGSRA